MKEPPKLPGQVVLVFQGGGALGAYQGGVYQALHEAGIEPDWVVGTSIGAHQRRHHRRQRGRCAARSPARILGSGRAEAALGRHAVRSAGRQCRLRICMSMFNGISGYYAPNRAHRLGRIERAGRRRARGLLHHRRLAGDGGNRLVDFERVNARPHASDRRRGQCAHRQDALFRQPQSSDHARPCAGVRRRAARLSRRCASTAIRIGTAGSIPTRPSRWCSTTIRGAIPSCSRCRFSRSPGRSRNRSGRC